MGLNGLMANLFPNNVQVVEPGILRVHHSAYHMVASITRYNIWDMKKMEINDGKKVKAVNN